jgi:hypothetical protein
VRYKADADASSGFLSAQICLQAFIIIKLHFKISLGRHCFHSKWGRSITITNVVGLDFLSLQELWRCSGKECGEESWVQLPLYQRLLRLGISDRVTHLSPQSSYFLLEAWEVKSQEKYYRNKERSKSYCFIPTNPGHFQEERWRVCLQSCREWDPWPWCTLPILWECWLKSSFH